MEWINEYLQTLFDWWSATMFRFIQTVLIFNNSFRVMHEWRKLRAIRATENTSLHFLIGQQASNDKPPRFRCFLMLLSLKIMASFVIGGGLKQLHFWLIIFSNCCAGNHGSIMQFLCLWADKVRHTTLHNKTRIIQYLEGNLESLIVTIVPNNILQYYPVFYIHRDFMNLRTSLNHIKQ